MKLFLTSAGFTNKKISDVFLKVLGKKPGEAKCLMVSAKSPEKEIYVLETRRELEALGFRNIELANINEAIDIEKLGDFDFLYICGGNTFYILDRMRKTGLDKYIQRQVQKGVIYVGVSAGSILAGKSIESAGWGSEADLNEIDLKDLTGLGFTDIAILPHYHDGVKEEVENFKKRSKHPVVILNDDQMVFCKDKDCKLVE